MNKPAAGLLKSMDAYAEGISFMCGDPLFEDDLEDQELVKLKETFFIKEARSCSQTAWSAILSTRGGSRGGPFFGTFAARHPKTRRWSPTPCWGCATGRSCCRAAQTVP